MDIALEYLFKWEDLTVVDVWLARELAVITQSGYGINITIGQKIGWE